MPEGARVAPGEAATFSFAVVAPPQAGAYEFQWRMLKEGVAWFGDASPKLTVDVNSNVFLAPAPPIPDLKILEAYAFPNPAVGARKPTFRVAIEGFPSELRLKVFDAAGELVDQAALSPRPSLDGRSQLFEHGWEGSRAKGGLYLYTIEASRRGSPPVRASGKLVIVR